VSIGYAFALGVHEVTVAQFAAFVADTGYTVAAGCRTLAESGWAWDPERSWRDPGLGASPSAEDPVVCVGRDDALAYVDWLSSRTGERYRLPSEAEWEYAARAGSTTRFPWGDSADAGCSHANLYDRSARARRDFGWSAAQCDDGFSEIAPVGRLAANAFGLHDLIGNVWEWTADCYRELYVDAPLDGSPATGECERWSVRGGSWMTRTDRNRSAFRGRDPISARYAYFGFRVAREWRP
jgi:formylglycine-generating enzyme required for sulfatase activity